MSWGRGGEGEGGRLCVHAGADEMLAEVRTGVRTGCGRGVDACVDGVRTMCGRRRRQGCADGSVDKSSAWCSPRLSLL